MAVHTLCNVYLDLFQLNPSLNHNNCKHNEFHKPAHHKLPVHIHFHNVLLHRDEQFDTVLPMYADGHYRFPDFLLMVVPLYSVSALSEPELPVVEL